MRRSALRDARIVVLQRKLARIPELEGELSTLSGMVIEREREIRGLNDELREAKDRHDRSIASLESVSARLEEIQAQARGQATRIRMKALQRGGRGQPSSAGAERPHRRRADAGRRGGELERRASARSSRQSSSKAWSGSRSARWATSRSWSASRTRPARSTPRRRSPSSGSPRAGRRLRCISTSRWTCCASWSSARRSSSGSAAPAGDRVVLDVDEEQQQGPEQRAA